MDPNPSGIRGARMALRSQKQQLVDRHGIGSDLPAVILTMQWGYPVGAYSLGTFDDPASRATAWMAIALSNCDVAFVVNECYVATTTDGDNLARRFAAGDPAVSEAITMMEIPREGEPRGHVDAYRYEGKRVIWQDGYEVPAEAHEQAAEQRRRLSGAFHEQSRRSGPALLRPGTRMHTIGTQFLDNGDALVGMAVHLSCYCGSGRPINECCNTGN